MNCIEASTQIVIICDEVRSVSTDYIHGLFSGWKWEMLSGKMKRAGIHPDSCRFFSVTEAESLDLTGALIITMGERSLRLLTGKSGIDKWQLSPLLSTKGQKVIPTFDMARTQKQYELGLYQELAFRRAKEESLSHTYDRAPERFLLNPSLEETLAVLDRLAQNETEIAIDVETGYGQINTIGFAWTPSDAIAINVLPDRCADHAYYELWKKISLVLNSPARKVFQNFIYDVSYFSAYGVRTTNIAWDTMWAMKFLWPELKSNLGNVGRIYTKRPYWKDDGKSTDEESGRRDWGNVRDWTKHYLYNCRDTTGTLEASRAQRIDLENRKLLSLFEGYVMRLADPILEMCSRGMPLSLERRAELKTQTEERITELMKRLHQEAGRELNPRSPKQVKEYLTDLKVKIPKKYDKASGEYKESTDASSIKKIRLKNPEIAALGTLAEVKSLDTMLSRYINFATKPGEALLRYSLNGTGTETLRFSGNADAWDRGFNIQTIPREGGEVSIKSMFVAPPGESFMEIDLRQAESRFVAYVAADKTLIDMLESGADVHTHVGNAILLQMGKDPTSVSKEEFKATWRQLGKKAGHGLNYGMKARVFVETVFNELDLVISVPDAEAITRAYYGLFPGIPRWHRWVREEVYTKKKLTAPSGWERYFYGRPGDDMLKEALAWCPQHTIPWIMNHLMFYLREERAAGRLDFNLHVQVHDSLILSAPDGSLNELARACNNLEAWHPRVDLPGGRMVIPVECKAGKTMDQLEEISGGK